MAFVLQVGQLRAVLVHSLASNSYAPKHSRTAVCRARAGKCVRAEDRLAGSYLFVGPDGVGKATAARQFAKMLCGASSDTDATSRAIDAGKSPDVRTLDPPPSRITSIAQVWPRPGHKEHLAENAMLRDLQYEPIAGPEARLYHSTTPRAWGGAGRTPGTAC